MTVTSCALTKSARHYRPKLLSIVASEEEVADFAQARRPVPDFNPVALTSMGGPSVIAAAFYSAGLVLGTLIPGRMVWLLVASFMVSGLALTVRRLRLPSLYLLLVLAGWTNLASRTEVLSPHDLRKVLANQPELIEIRGRLFATPTLRLYERGNRVRQRTVVDLEATALRRPGQEWQPALGRIAASSPGVLGPEFFAGQDVRATGVIQAPAGPAAPGQFDYATYLQYRGVYFQLRCDSANDWQVVPALPGAPRLRPPLGDRFCDWAQETLARGLGPQDESLGLLWAMVLGWQTGLTQEVAEPFMQSGTMHVFAISGLHIALIAGIIVSLLRVLRLPRGASGLVVIPLIWFYTAATSWQASAIRSTVMMTIVIAGWALRRPSHLINSLAAAAFVILVWQPTQLFQASFQLSFFVVLGIALLTPPLERVRSWLLQPDPLLPAELRPRWKRWLDTPVRVVTTSLGTSAAAWLGSMPLIAYYFYMITPVSLVANLLIVPLSSLALMSSLGSLVCGSWCSTLTVLFNHSSWAFMLWMVRLSEWFARWPGGYVYVPRPHAFEFVVYYALLAGVLNGVFVRPRWRGWAAAVAGALVFLLGIHWLSDRDAVKITVLPTPASVTFVDRPGRARDLLVDSGDANTAQSLVKPLLRSQGVNRLSTLLISHGDVRHVAGLELIADHFRVLRILTSPQRPRSPAFRRLVGTLEGLGEAWGRVARGDAIAGWEVLHPAGDDQFARGEDGAISLRAVIHGVRVLLISDLGRTGQGRLLDREGDLRADILVSGLASGDGALSHALLDAVRPSLIIVAGANFPATARPSKVLRERLAQRNVPVFYTSDSGAAVLAIRATGWTLERF
jgi:competence protein ComEC